VAGRRWFVGKASLFLGVSTVLHERQRDLERAGKTVIFVGDSEPRGLIALRDRVRPEARPMVARLRELGIKHVVSLSGDNRGTAAAAAAECGITEVHAELFPEDKVRIVRELADR